MKLPRWARFIGACAGGLLLAGALAVGGVWIYFHPRCERLGPEVYGQRHGRALMLEVLRPPKPNGAGVLLLVSGGWRSGTNSFRPWLAAPLLRRGFTVFAVYHLSQPTATVMEICEDMHRAVRFIRHHPERFGVDPQRLGVTGGSSGGHLGLMLATRGGPGPADAEDPVDRESSAVQAVAVFFPVTDLLNLGSSTENPGDGGPPKSFVRAFGPDSTNLAIWRVIGREVSPIYHIRSNLPPILIYHGDADTLVPLDQSERFQQEAQKVGATVKLVVRRGGRHGWLSMIWDIRHFAQWFEQHLLASPRTRAHLGFEEEEAARCRGADFPIARPVAVGVARAPAPEPSVNFVGEADGRSLVGALVAGAPVSKRFGAAIHELNLANPPIGRRVDTESGGCAPRQSVQSPRQHSTNATSMSPPRVVKPRPPLLPGPHESERRVAEAGRKAPLTHGLLVSMFR